jgi:hypothetical protein
MGAKGKRTKSIWHWKTGNSTATDERNTEQTERSFFSSDLRHARLLGYPEWFQGPRQISADSN